MDYKTQIRTSQWQRKRLEIMQRDDFKCRICTSDGFLNVHHLYYLPNVVIWDYDSEGIITLCQECHEKITHDLPKLSGIVAFQILAGKIDPLSIIENFNNNSKK